jgi:UPF0755 protein
LTFFIVLSICAFGVAMASFTLNRAPAERAVGQAVIFEVPRGSSASAVSDRLGLAGLIRSPLFFRIYLKLSGSEALIKAGTYEIGPGLGSIAISRLLVSGRQAVRKVTLAEGLTLREISLIMEESAICPRVDFIAAATDQGLLSELGIPGKSAEGYLFPDTYEFPLNADARFVVRIMTEAFFAQLSTIDPNYRSLSGEELAKIVIIASIVEREYRVAEEAPMIASVFFNRLRIGMALQSCATVVYVITDRLGKPHPDIVYDRDLTIKDPYNTYAQAGLPPGPISNPGRISLAAAMRPATSGYLYFRLTDAERGAHTFTRSLSEHLNAGTYAVKAKSGAR